MSTESPLKLSVYHADQPKSALFITFSLRRRHPETHHFWMGSCNIFLSLISVGSDRALPSCPSGQQWTLWCHFPLGFRLALYEALRFLILTVRTCPSNDTRGVATQCWLLYKNTKTHWLRSYIKTHNINTNARWERFTAHRPCVFSRPIWPVALYLAGCVLIRREMV